MYSRGFGLVADQDYAITESMGSNHGPNQRALVFKGTQPIIRMRQMLVQSSSETCVKGWIPPHWILAIPFDKIHSEDTHHWAG